MSLKNENDFSSVFFCPYFFKWWNRCFLYTVFSSNLFAEIEWYISRLFQNENCSSNESERGQFSCLENGTANFLKKLLTKWRCRTPQENKTFTRLVSLAARPSGSLTDRKRMMAKKYHLTLRFGSGIQNFFLRAKKKSLEIVNFTLSEYQNEIKWKTCTLFWQLKWRY